MRTSSRRLLMFSLVLAFCVQTWMVYADPAGRVTPLSAEAARGREIWHIENCQSCHQLYGFGGFLGPDLTNAAERLTAARLEAILTVGAGQMPAFELGADERDAIAAFLTEVHATGVGQLQPLRSFDAPETLVRAVDAATAGGAALEGAEARGRDVLLAQKCLGCHLPNPVSEKEAADLTGLVGRLGTGGVSGILSTGIPAKGMPRFDLAPEEHDALLSFLAWLSRNAETVRTVFADAAPQRDEARGLPWFEYE